MTALSSFERIAEVRIWQVAVADAFHLFVHDHRRLDHGARLGLRRRGLGQRLGASLSLLDNLGGAGRTDVELLVPGAHRVRPLDRLRERTRGCGVREDFFVGHELELVDHLLLEGVGHCDEQPVFPNEDREDDVPPRDLERDQIQIHESDTHLLEVDGRYAEFLAERFQLVDVGRDSILRLRGVAGAYRPLLERDAPDVLLVALAHGSDPAP